MSSILGHGATPHLLCGSTEDDQPIDASTLETLGELRLPTIIFGTATFSNYYNSNAFLETSAPFRAVRLALRYGIRAFDTAPLYGSAELMLGNILRSLDSEFPRSSYKLITKCGRFGSDTTSFDYSPANIRATVLASLDRLKTSYLDVVYLHDVEFVCREVSPWLGGNPLHAICEKPDHFGLAEGQEGTVREEGERKVLAAIDEMRRLQNEGLIKNVGISGFPLPSLLRIALLVLHTPPYKPLDVVLSYSHLHFQNTTFKAFAAPLYNRAKVRQLIAASPLNMALFTNISELPSWHEAPPKLRDAVALARQTHADWPGGIVDLALGYAFRTARSMPGGVPVALGLSTPQEVHECMKAWWGITLGDSEERKAKEESILDIIDQSGYQDWSWAYPPP